MDKKLTISEISVLNDPITNTVLKYMTIAKSHALISKATDKKVGAIIVKDNTVISSGYNGLPRQVREHNDPRYKDPNWDLFPEYIRNKLFKAAEDKGLTLEECKNIDPRRLLDIPSGTATHLVMHVHAELNAIINAARAGVSTINSEMFCYCGIPCSKCMMAIINAGINGIACLKSISRSDKSEYLQSTSRIMAKQTGLTILEVPTEQIDNYIASLKENVLL